LRLIDELSDLQAREDLRLRNVELVVGQIGDLGGVHIERHPIIDHPDGDGIAALTDNQAIVPEGHVRLNERNLLVGGFLPLRKILLNLRYLADRPGKIVLSLLGQRRQRFMELPKRVGGSPMRSAISNALCSFRPHSASG
jgi:hypothetical protein